MAVERHQEINNLEEVIKSTNGQIEIKRQRLQRAKNLNDFALCDILSSAITALLVKKADHKRQLTALNKKNAKSKKYLLKKISKNPSQSQMSQKKKNTSILDMMCMKKTGVEIGKQSTDSQVIVVEEEQSVIERSESSSSEIHLSSKNLMKFQSNLLITKKICLCLSVVNLLVLEIHLSSKNLMKFQSNLLITKKTSLCLSVANLLVLEIHLSSKNLMKFQRSSMISLTYPMKMFLEIFCQGKIHLLQICKKLLLRVRWICRGGNIY